MKRQTELVRVEYKERTNPRARWKKTRGIIWEDIRTPADARSAIKQARLWYRRRFLFRIVLR